MSDSTCSTGLPAAPALALTAATATLGLTPSELRMLELFRATTDKQLLLGFAAVCVETTPCHKRPVLRLVQGGAS